MEALSGLSSIGDLMQGTGDTDGRTKKLNTRTGSYFPGEAAEGGGSAAKAQGGSHVVGSRTPCRLHDGSWDHGLRACRSDMGAM